MQTETPKGPGVASPSAMETDSAEPKSVGSHWEPPPLGDHSKGI